MSGRAATKLTNSVRVWARTGGKSLADGTWNVAATFETDLESFLAFLHDSLKLLGERFSSNVVQLGSKEAPRNAIHALLV
jgi:hypothetical protein